MAIGDPYATTAELRTRLELTGTGYDARLLEALNSASRGIEKITRRQFNQVDTAYARVYYPDSASQVRTDDFYTTTGLAIAVDYGDDGTYETTLSTSDYQLEPLNGVVDGESGWPYYRIVMVRGYTLPTCAYRAPVQVTAKWGWSSVPAPIKEATLIVAAETFKLREAPFGVAGFAEYGPVRVRGNPIAMAMIAPYRAHAVLVA